MLIYDKVRISCALSLVERACSIIIQNTELNVTPSANLRCVQPFPGLISSLFLVNWK